MSSSPLNVAEHLVRMARDNPSQVAIYFPRRRVKTIGETEHLALTYEQLNTEVDAIAHGLCEAGVKRGMRIALMAPPSPAFFALTFALFKIAAAPVLIDPGMGIRNVGKCLGEAEPEAFVGIARAHLARRVLGWGKKTIRLSVNVGDWRLYCHTSLVLARQVGSHHGAYIIPDVKRDEPAAILFTSGSTGPAKGAVYTHGNFAAQVEILKHTYDIAVGEVDLCTFPLFALFGPALGMTCIIPDMNPTRPAHLNPHKALAQIRQFRVSNLFGSPAVIRRLGNDPDLSSSGLAKESLSTVRRVISAGAPASISAIEKIVQLLPDSSQVFTPYGATEALPVANIGSREILSTRELTEQGKGVCVGRPVEGMQVEVIRISDHPIAEWSDSLILSPGEVGEFVVRGPVVTHRYHNRPDATKLAKIRDPHTNDILHRMGDVGYRDEQGRLWFCGRKSHRVETPSGTLFTDMVEPIFNTLPGVFRTALVAVQRSGVMIPVVCVELEGGRLPRGVEAVARRQAILEAASRHEHTRPIRTFLFHRGFPVDVRHNSKIFREKLAIWADRKLGKHWRLESPR